MTKRNTEIMVGLFVVLGAVALVFLALKAANLARFAPSSGYRMAAKFDNIGGLKPRAPVRSAGVHVGQVKSITLDPKTFQSVVTFELDQQYHFPKDSSAKILTAGLLGDQYVGIEAGILDESLQPGDVITQTQSAVVLENLIGQFIFNKAAEAGSGGGAAEPKP